MQGFPENKKKLKNADSSKSNPSRSSLRTLLMCVAVPVSAETLPSARIFLHSYDFAVFRTFLGNRGERELLVKSDTLGSVLVALSRLLHL